MTAGYNGHVIGRDSNCHCEDFPCCGHGLTQADIDSEYEREYDDYMERQWYADYGDDDDRDTCEQCNGPKGHMSVVPLCWPCIHATYEFALKHVIDTPCEHSDFECFYCWLVPFLRHQIQSHITR